MARHIRGTLNSSNADSVHILIFTAILYTLYTIGILKHLEALIFKNYICIVALALNSRRVSFHSLVDFLPNSTTIKLL
jgi:ABC-type glucose/galactose transport system permease subunit